MQTEARLVVPLIIMPTFGFDMFWMFLWAPLLGHHLSQTYRSFLVHAYVKPKAIPYWQFCMVGCFTTSSLNVRHSYHQACSWIPLQDLWSQGNGIFSEHVLMNSIRSHCQSYQWILHPIWFLDIFGRYFGSQRICDEQHDSGSVSKNPWIW